jgi:hypothetical protein
MQNFMEELDMDAYSDHQMDDDGDEEDWEDY